MPYCDWKDKDWDTLIYSIQQGDCILMLGPDAATLEVDGQQHPLTEILAHELSAQIPAEICKHIDTSDLFQVAQYYAGQHGKSDLQVKVKSFYEAKKQLTTPLHQALAALPFSFTITTTPDNMFPQALEQSQIEPLIGWYHFNGKAQDAPSIQVSSNGKPSVYYLYGHPFQPKSLLLTENDQLDFLVSLISRNPGLPDNIRSILKDEEKSFLFFGFGFKQWYLRILLHILQDKGKKNSRSFALEPGPGSLPETDINYLQRTVFFFKQSDYRIQIFKQDFTQFALELSDRFRTCTPEVTTRVEEEKKAKIFISYATEDKKAAQRLYKKLETAGFSPWRDKENLRGGDKWDDVIEKNIGEVDYFILLQSKALENRVKSVVYEEIEYALKQQSRFRPGIDFIVPVKIEECSCVDNLKDFHTLDLSGDKDFDKMVKDIKRDLEKRKKK